MEQESVVEPGTETWSEWDRLKVGGGNGHATTGIPGDRGSGALGYLAGAETGCEAVVPIGNKPLSCISFFKNLLFLTVSLPDPSTFTTYLSYPLHSTTTPVRSHLVGFEPCWFWMATLSPSFKS